MNLTEIFDHALAAGVLGEEPNAIPQKITYKIPQGKYPFSTLLHHFLTALTYRLIPLKGSQTTLTNYPNQNIGSFFVEAARLTLEPDMDPVDFVQLYGMTEKDLQRSRVSFKLLEAFYSAHDMIPVEQLSLLYYRISSNTLPQKVSLDLENLPPYLNLSADSLNMPSSFLSKMKPYTKSTYVQNNLKLYFGQTYNVKDSRTGKYVTQEALKEIASNIFSSVPISTADYKFLLLNFRDEGSSSPRHKYPLSSINFGFSFSDIENYKVPGTHDSTGVNYGNVFSFYENQELTIPKTYYFSSFQEISPGNYNVTLESNNNDDIQLNLYPLTLTEEHLDSVGKLYTLTEQEKEFLSAIPWILDSTVTYNGQQHSGIETLYDYFQIFKDSYWDKRLILALSLATGVCIQSYYQSLLLTELNSSIASKKSFRLGRGSSLRVGGPVPMDLPIVFSPDNIRNNLGSDYPLIHSLIRGMYHVPKRQSFLSVIGYISVLKNLKGSLSNYLESMMGEFKLAPSIYSYLQYKEMLEDKELSAALLTQVTPAPYQPLYGGPIEREHPDQDLTQKNFLSASLGIPNVKSYKISYSAERSNYSDLKRNSGTDRLIEIANLYCALDLDEHRTFLQTSPTDKLKRALADHKKGFCVPKAQLMENNPYLTLLDLLFFLKTFFPANISSLGSVINVSMYSLLGDYYRERGYSNQRLTSYQTETFFRYFSDIFQEPTFFFKSYTDSDFNSNTIKNCSVSYRESYRSTYTISNEMTEIIDYAFDLKLPVVYEQDGTITLTGSDIVQRKNLYLEVLDGLPSIEAFPSIYAVHSLCNLDSLFNQTIFNTWLFSFKSRKPFSHSFNVDKVYLCAVRQDPLFRDLVNDFYKEINESYSKGWQPLLEKLMGHKPLFSSYCAGSSIKTTFREMYSSNSLAGNGSLYLSGGYSPYKGKSLFSLITHLDDAAFLPLSTNIYTGLFEAYDSWFNNFLLEFSSQVRGAGNRWYQEEFNYNKLFKRTLYV